MQCQRLSVWSVNFTFNTFLPKLYFSRGFGGVHKTCGNTTVVGVIFAFKKWKFQGVGRTCMKFPP